MTFPDSAHVTSLGLGGETPDEIIWEHARQEGFTIITADFDFVRIAEERGAPPKIVRLERMDYSTKAAAELIRRYSVVIADLEKNSKPVLTLRKV